MTQEHLITPPPELVEQWYDSISGDSTSWKQELATQAAELEGAGIGCSLCHSHRC